MLRFYLAHGQRLGHSPNIFFDESWYLETHKDASDRVRAGAFRSGFDHYCGVGRDTLAPHWLFDDVLYKALNADVAGANLPSAGFLNRYDHFLRIGSSENRPPHILFDPHFYRAHMPGADLDGAGPFAHFLRRIHEGDEAQTAIYFDPEWYRATYVEVDAAIREGRWLSALHHYLCTDSPADFDPLCQFSEHFYRQDNPDLQPALAAGTLRSGYQHFLSHGVLELRAPTPLIDLRQYRLGAASARHGAGEGSPRDLFARFLEARRRDPPSGSAVTEEQARALYELRARNLAAQLGRQPLDFTLAAPAELSVIVVVHDRFALTMMGLAALRSNYGGAIELIVVDSGSSDETRHIARYVTGAEIMRFASNVGFVRGCNAALPRASAPAVLYMNNDIELAPGCIAAALCRLDTDPAIGAVGGKVLRTHGALQEAGSIIWRDGRASGYLRDASPLAPEAGFVRDVDFCSGVFLLVRGAPLRALGGFDEAFAPAYYEDADLCVRLWQAGYRVVYDPAVQLTHYEYGSARSADAPLALMERHRQTFCRKHRRWLKHRYAHDNRLDVFARSRSAPSHRVLFIEDTVPLHATGSGYGRANDILRGMVALGCEVTVFPVNGCRFEMARVLADLPETVEIMHDRNVTDLDQFLEQRPGYYDVIWVSRAHNLDKIGPALERTYADPDRVSIVLDTEAVFSLREAVRAAMAGTVFDLGRALDREFANVWLCQRVVAVSAAEAQILRRLGLSDIAVLGTMREPTPTPLPYHERTGLLFVGSVHATDSPNYDSLRWFIDEVLPLVREQLGARARLTVAGYTAPGVNLGRWRAHPDVELRGAVEDLAPLYDAHRVFVAPTRYAAGAPYKVYEAAGHGLPVVASELLCRQLGWADGTEILAGDVSDPALFARQIADLYGSAELWTRLRANAVARLQRENAPAEYHTRLCGILEPLPTPARASPRMLRPTLVPESLYPAAAE